MEGPEDDAGSRTAFRATRPAAVRSGLRSLIAVALACAPLFLVLDWVQYPAHLRAFLAIRLGDAAVQLVLLRLLTRRDGERFVGALGLIGPVSASIASTAMAVLTGGPGSAYTMGPIFVILCTAILVPWSPAGMLRVGLATIAASLACTLAGTSRIDVHLLGATLGAYAATVFIAVASAAARDRRRWQAFRHARALADATARLGASEAQLRAILGSVMDPLLTIDAHGIVRSASASAEPVLGWTPDALVGRHLTVLLPAEEQERQAAALARLHQAPAGLAYATEIAVRRRDGSTFPCELAVARVGLPPGAEPLFTGVLHDVSERRRVEEARTAQLRLLEAIDRAQARFIADAEPRGLFRDLLETLLAASGSTYGFIGEIVHDPDGQPFLQGHAIAATSWDAATRALSDSFERTGFRFDHLQALFGDAMTSGRPVIADAPATASRRDGFPPGQPALDAFLGVPLHHGDELVGLVGLANRPGGYDRALVDHLAPLARTVASLIWAHRKDRARRAAERAVAEQGEVSAALAQVAQTLIASLDTPVVLERLCQVTAAVLGCDSSHTLLWQAREDAFAPVAAHGRPPGPPAVGPIPREMLARLLAELEHADVVEVDDARVRGFLRAAGHPDGRPPGPRLCVALRRGRDVVGVLVAHRHAPDGAFGSRERRIAQGLAQIASLALANARLVEELERASRLKSEFVSTMSHELRTPLHVILGFTEMLREVTDPGERDRFVDTVERAGRELLALIESTLEVGRIEAGRHEVRLQPVALPVFWRELEASCGMLPRATSVTLDWGTTLPDATLTTDPHKLAIVIRNLVGNALKFTERGCVQADAERCGDRVRFRVRDTGIGIPPEHRTTIFEMFRQGDGSDARRYGGTGLGLYIVRRFVDILGGTIALDSTPGGGSTFTVDIPLTGPTGPTTTAATRARAA